jgi:hypothetical protein
LPDCANSKKRSLLANTPRLLRLSGPSVCTVACGAKQAGTGEAGPDGPKSEENYFRINFGIFEYTKLWKFVGGDLGGILIWGFFINSFGLLKDFRKI